MPSNNLPNPQSYEQILGDALSSYASKIGINDYNVGSAVTSFFEVVALIAARASGDIFQILRDFSVDRATGDALQRLATENNITPITAQPATGLVSVTDTSFTKISTNIYAGTNPPNIGSTVINVSDASKFPSSGSVYIGRGTPNVEGPLSYTTPPAQVGNFWQITLSVATTKFHNLNETVILAQGGNRSIPVNAIAVSPAIGATPDLQYSVTTAAIILDGETTVGNVPVTALLPGASGNIPIGAIKNFSANPFSGATVTNPLSFTTGKDNETDDQLRVRIKRQLASIGLGTATAVQAAVIGATAPDEAATITSTDIVQASYGAVMFIDNGALYEAISNGVGLESIVDSAIGGEQFFQLATGGTQAPVAKAFIQTTLGAPFDLIGGDSLAVIVGGVTYQHNFVTADFRSPGSATAYEVTASINADTALGFEAVTAGDGTYVVVRDKTEGKDSVQVTTPITTGRDAAVQMGFPSGQVLTLRLFKNQIPLSKDGNTATVSTQQQSLWSSTITNGDTLILAVDGTAPITYNIYDTDFIATGLYTSVSSTNSLESWVEVFNNKLTGVTAEIVGAQISITSNLNASNRAAVVISGSSTLVSKAMFTLSVGLSSQGSASDYTLDRNTAQFELAVPLKAGDNLTAGSTQTQGFVKSSAISAGSVTFSSAGYAWILTDAPGSVIPTGVSPSSLLAVSKPSTKVVRYTSNVSNAFGNVLVGDYLIIWSTDLVAADRLEGRVHAVTGTTIDILVTASEYASAVTTAGVTYNAGFIILRSQSTPQKFEVTGLPAPTFPATLTLDQIATGLQAQTKELFFDVQLEEYLVVSTVTANTSGSVMIVTADAQGSLIDLPIADLDQSKGSLIAFYDSGQADAQFPLFIHSQVASDAVASPPDSFIPSFTSAQSLSGTDPNNLISILQPYGTIEDAQPFGEYVQEDSVSGGTTVAIANQSLIRRLRGNVDRYFLASPLEFGSKDTSVVIVDNDPTANTFSIPLFRTATTYSGGWNSPTTFNAYDTAAGASAAFVGSFGSSFSFANYKVLMQAKKTLNPLTVSSASILYRSVRWGKSGQFINVGYSYPTVPNAAISSTVVVNENITILISLMSGNASSTTIDASTQWNVTVASGVPSSGIDQVTFTWNGVGTAPSLSLVSGQYVNITSQTGFALANTGIFSISGQAGYTPTSTSFSVQMPHGQAVAQSNVQTLAIGAINFYLSSSTTATAINTYVNANLSQYVTSTLVAGAGSGVIALSTAEDSAFAYSTVFLQDGVNWIASSNLSASPQFTLKNALAYPSDGLVNGYSFYSGEAVQLIPTTMAQVQAFISILAVTGFTTVGTASLSDRGSQLEMATDTIGSSGSIQIIGGLANGYEVPVLDSGTRVDNVIMNASVNSIAGAGIHSGHWFRLAASQTQVKETLLNTNTSITLVPGQPTAGQTIVQLLNRQLNQRYFGKYRHHIRSQGDTFRIERQGSLACMSWDPNSGTTPHFLKSAMNFNDSGGGTFNAYKVIGTSYIQYVMVTGSANFNDMIIGDLVTIGGSNANAGTFLVVGVSDDGTNMQVLNPSGVNQYSSGTFTFNSNLSNGDQFTIGATTLTAVSASPTTGQFLIGGTTAQSAANFNAIAGTVPGVTSSFNGTSVVTITATTPSASIAISSTSSHVTVSGASLVGVTFSAGFFSGSTSVSEGDTMTVKSPFNVLNQGQYRVIRRYNDSVWFENANVVEEEVTLPYNPIALGYDTTTAFSVNASSHTQFITWTGVGTEPSLGNATMGDIMTFATGFTSPSNQGKFMVLRSGVKLQQITQFVLPTGTQFTPSIAGQYFLINSGANVDLYYVWFNVNGTNTNPAIGGRTGIMVSILSGDNSTQVAQKAAAAILAAAPADFTTSSSGSTLTVTTTAYAPTNSAVNGTVPAPFSVNVTQLGTRTFLECVNPSATNQSSLTISDASMLCHRPQLQFSEYEATVPGDNFNLTNNAFLAANVGAYQIIQVLNRDTAIVSGTLTAITNISLNGIVGSAFVEEGSAYFGYKRVLFASAQPGSSTQMLVTFDTNAQSDAINQSAGVQMVAMNKLNFSTLIKNGLDSYRYSTGLIREANRIVYGDPRDNITYPGVGAAGADIFIREPLALRIQMALDIRLNTGVPYAQTVQQVQNSVSSLVNSNDIGVSISISSILSAVQAIPGILAVSISFPNFSPTSDLITLVPGQKAVIIDPAIDISVSQVGT